MSSCRVEARRAKRSSCHLIEDAFEAASRFRCIRGRKRTARQVVLVRSPLEVLGCLLADGSKSDAHAHAHQLLGPFLCLYSNTTLPIQPMSASPSAAVFYRQGTSPEVDLI